MSKTNLNFMCIVGYAGHGKDTAKNILQQHYNKNSFYNLSYADTMKNQLANALPDSIIEQGKGESRFEKLNDLKDNHPHLEVMGGRNARQLLQHLGTEFYRSMDEDIHVRFAAARILNEMEKSDKPPVFVSSDTRFPNELNFLLKASQMTDSMEVQDFLKDFLQRSKPLPTQDDVVEAFEKHLELSVEKSQERNLFEEIWKGIEGLKTPPVANKTYDIAVPDSGSMTKEQAASFGVLHIFRPLISPDAELKADADASELMAKIKSYTQMSMDEVADIRDRYKFYNLDFNADNILKYGFVRADVTHFSESAINDKKPEAFVSGPMNNPLIKEQYVEQLTQLFDTAPTLKAALDPNGSQNKNKTVSKRKI